MNENELNNNNVFQDDSSVYNKRPDVIPVPEREIGVDTKGQFYDVLVDAGINSRLDIARLESFTQVSQRRDQIYSMIDTMRLDSTISSALEMYAEDSTEPNETQQIVWVDSSDDAIRHYVQYLLDYMNVDKHIYEWALNLCAYGDIYIRLYRDSDYNDDFIFRKDAVDALNDLTTDDDKRKKLHEEVKIKAYSENDHYSKYVELMSNPAEYFELTKHGKTYGYIKAPVVMKSSFDPNMNNAFVRDQFNRMSFNKKDVTIYDATQFVHGALYDTSTRTPEEVDIIIDSQEDKQHEGKYTYNVKRGQSLLYSVFKVWRELTLLENAIILNRITKSSVVRIVQVEIGNMSREMIGPHLQGIKSMFEQRSALDTNVSLSEYSNPGPTENNIYVPKKGEVGTISVQNIGGDNANVTGLADLDYFKNKFYGALRIPKAFLGDTGDNAGFDAGKSLALMSSRYAKMVKRIQNVLCETIESIINLILLDVKLKHYIGKFKICMLAPTTQEALDRRDNLREKVGIVQDVMNMLSDVQNPVLKLKVLKTMLATTITDTEVISLIQDEIDEQANAAAEEKNSNPPSDNNTEDVGSDLGDISNSGGSSSSPSSDLGGGIDLDKELDLAGEGETEEPSTGSEPAEGDDIILPQPNSLGQDFTQIK